MPYIAKSKKGFALSIVMWIVAALLLGIAMILNLSKDSLSLTKGVQDKLSARLKAQSYLEVMKYYVLTANFDSVKLINNVSIGNYKLPREIVLDGREYNLSKNITISMQDTSSMINVFYPDAQMIAALASHGNDKLYYTIRDSIDDWIDADSKVRLNGAEDNYYKKYKNADYKPRNYPALQSVEELRLIKGIDTLSQKEFDDLKRYLYFSQRGTSIDMALLDANYLSKILHIDIQTAQKIIKYKDINYAKFLNIIEKNHYYNDEYMDFALSFNIKLKIKVKVNNATVYLVTLINFKSNQFRNISTDIYKIY